MTTPPDLPPLPEPATCAYVQGRAMQGGEYRDLAADYDESSARYSVVHMRAYVLADRAAGRALEAVPEWINSVVRNVCELGDRSSPDDWPEAMIVTAEELTLILQTAIEDLAPAATPQPSTDMVAHPTHQEIAAHFKLHHGGPNPYYACVHCEEVEPGLEECLVKHMHKCGYGPGIAATPQPSADMAPGPRWVMPGRWPFIEAPMFFAERMERAHAEFNGDWIAAVRHVLIERPPMIDGNFASPAVSVTPNFDHRYPVEVQAQNSPPGGGLAIRSRVLADEVLLALEAYSDGGLDKETLAEDWASGLLPKVYDTLNLFALAAAPKLATTAQPAAPTETTTACPYPEGSHLRLFWQDGFNGKSGGRYGGDFEPAAMQAITEGKSARAALAQPSQPAETGERK